jgi:hypothetical protein
MGPDEDDALWKTGLNAPDLRRRRLLATGLSVLWPGVMMASEVAPAGWVVKLQPIEMSGIADAERVAWAPGGSAALVFALPTGRTGMQLLRRAGPGGASLTLATFDTWRQWDLAAAAGGLQLVYTEPASAMVALATRRLPDGEPDRVNRHLDFAVFSRPRFVRHAAGSPLPLTAVALLGSPRQASAVAFLPDTDGGYRPHQLLPTVGEGRVLAVQLLLEPAGGFVMLVLLARPLEPARDGSPAAVLVAQRLDAQLRASGQAWQPLGDTIVHEFDADLAGERLLAFATTAHGWVLAVAGHRAQGEAANLRSPIVRADGEALHLAALAVEPGAVRLLGARVALPP